MRSRHVPWAKKDQITKEINLQIPLNDYWTSKDHTLTVQGLLWSPTNPCISDGETQRSLSLGSIVALSSYASLRALQFVSLPPRIASASTIPIGGISLRFAQRSQRIAKGTLPNDGCTNGEGCGQGYQIRGCVRRGQFTHEDTSKTLTHSS
jgi:hypothetical protein